MIQTHSPPFFGWRVVAAAFVVAMFGWGVGFYGPPVYLETVRHERGWPVALVSGAVTLHFLAGVGVIASLPALHRRFGLPRVTLAGAIVLAVGVIGWSLAATPWQLYAATLLTGAGWPALGAVAINAIVSPWFTAQRPAALSMAYNGASIGGVVFSPLWVALIAILGFPIAALAIGSVMIVVIAALAASVLRRSPAKSIDGAPTNGQAAADHAAPMARLRRDPAFVTLGAAMALGLFAQIGLIAQLVSILTPALGTRGAGLAAGLSTAAAIAGRSLMGWLMTATTDRRLAASASLLVQTAGCAAFILSGGTHEGLLWIGLVLFGFGIGNATSLPPLIAQTEFAAADVGRVVAAIVALSQATYAFAPAAFGLIRQVASDRLIFIAAAAIQLAAIAFYLSGRGLYRKRASPTP